jgi:MFS family permease
MLVYYSTRIFANIGLSPFLSQLLAAVMNTIFAIGTYFTPGTIERFGRRQIMLWTALGCGVSIMVFTIMIGLPNQTPATQWTAVAFVILYNLFYGYGWVGCPWLYGPEVSYFTRQVHRRDTKTLPRFRLLLFDIDISAALLGHLVNGFSRSSRSSPAELAWTELDGKSGFGKLLPASVSSLSYISCAQR